MLIVLSGARGDSVRRQHPQCSRTHGEGRRRRAEDVPVKVEYGGRFALDLPCMSRTFHADGSLGIDWIRPQSLESLPRAYSGTAVAHWIDNVESLALSLRVEGRVGGIAHFRICLLNDCSRRGEGRLLRITCGLPERTSTSASLLSSAHAPIFAAGNTGRRGVAQSGSAPEWGQDRYGPRHRLQALQLLPYHPPAIPGCSTLVCDILR